MIYILWRVHSGPVLQGEGTLLATGSYDGQARIWTTNGRSFFVSLDSVLAFKEF